MIREIVLDTETTGLDPKRGHRIVEIGCIELINHLPTNNQFHVYINPEREMDAGAIAIHGITNEFLLDKPLFKDITQDFLEFISDSPLVIHNAPFDMKFLNAELRWAGLKELAMQRAIDTLVMARQKFPGSPASLDALCKRFEIDKSGRVKHGALIDSDLLAQVYLELIGGRQPDLLAMEDEANKQLTTTLQLYPDPSTPVRPIREFAIPDIEYAAHQKLLEEIERPLWGVLQNS